MRLGINDYAYKLFDVLLGKKLFADALRAVQNIKDAKIKKAAFEDLLMSAARAGKKEILLTAINERKDLAYPAGLQFLFFCIDNGRLGQGQIAYIELKKQGNVNKDIQKAFDETMEILLESKKKMGIEDLPKLDNMPAAREFRLQLEKYLVHMNQIASFIYEIFESNEGNIMPEPARRKRREKLLEVIYYIADSRRMLDNPAQYPYILYMLPAADLKIYKNIFR